MMRRKQGFTLLEMLTVMIISILLIGVLFAITMQSTRVLKNVDHANSAAERTRRGIELVQDDAEQSSAILAKYPANSPEFTSNASDTIIFLRPKLDTNGAVVADTYDVVIYCWEKADGDAKGPLNRYLATLSHGVGTEAQLDRKVLDDVTSLKFTYSAHENFLANNWQVNWGLRGTPIGNLPGAPQNILIGTKDWNGTEWAWFDSASIWFKRAPVYGMPIDVIYNVAPAVVVGEHGESAADVAAVQLTTTSSQRMANYKDRQQTRAIQFAAEIKNR